MNLTTLSRAKNYLQGVSGFTGADTLYNQLIAAASAEACQFCSRTFQRTVYAPAYLNGNGSDRMILPKNPIIAVASLSINGAAQTLIAGDPTRASTAGFQFDDKYLYLFGGPVFCEGRRNIAVSFTAGYSTSETDFIPALTPFTVTPVVGSGVDAAGHAMDTSGPALVDRGVTFVIGGTALALVANAPATGQYTFVDGVYTFAAADAGKQVTISYDFVPGGVEQAIIDTIGTWLKRRDNLGISSRSNAHETVSYRDQGLSKLAVQLLQPYRWVFLPQ